MTSDSNEDQIEDEIIELILEKFSGNTSIPLGLFDRGRSYFSAISRSCFSGFCDNIYNDPVYGWPAPTSGTTC